jgi:hypothetical protein
MDTKVQCQGSLYRICGGQCGSIFFVHVHYPLPIIIPPLFQINLSKAGRIGCSIKGLLSLTPTLKFCKMLSLHVTHLLYLYTFNLNWKGYILSDKIPQHSISWTAIWQIPTYNVYRHRNCNTYRCTTKKFRHALKVACE